MTDTETPAEIPQPPEPEAKTVPKPEYDLLKAKAGFYDMLRLNEQSKIGMDRLNKTITQLEQKRNTNAPAP